MKLTGVDLVSGELLWKVGKVAPDISRGGVLQDDEETCFLRFVLREVLRY